MINILITGGAGFIGSNLVSFLLKHNFKITVIDNLLTGNINNLELNNKNLKFIEADICNHKILDDLNDKFDYIIHLAAQPSNEASFENVLLDLDINAKSTLILLEFASKNKCKKIIFTSSVGVYGGQCKDNYNLYSEKSDIDLNSFYTIHKFTSEQYLKLYKKYFNIDYTIFRLFNCYGPKQSFENMKQGIISIYLKQFIDNNYKNVIIKGSLERYRDFIYIDDVVKILHESIINPNFNNKILNLGTGKKNTVLETINLLKKIGNYKKDYVVENQTNGDMYGTIADNKELLKLLKPNFNFTTFEEGLKLMINSI